MFLVEVLSIHKFVIFLTQSRSCEPFLKYPFDEIKFSLSFDWKQQPIWMEFNYSPISENRYQHFSSHFVSVAAAQNVELLFEWMQNKMWRLVTCSRIYFGIEVVLFAPYFLAKFKKLSHEIASDLLSSHRMAWQLAKEIFCADLIYVFYQEIMS